MWCQVTPPTCALTCTLPTLPQVGNLLRVDGTLMGLDEKKRALIPRWKRGHFSLLVNGGALRRQAAAVVVQGRALVFLCRNLASWPASGLLSAAVAVLSEIECRVWSQQREWPFASSSSPPRGTAQAPHPLPPTWLTTPLAPTTTCTASARRT